MQRVMGEAVFLTRDAKTIGAKLRAAGFEFLITADIDKVVAEHLLKLAPGMRDCGTAFVMIWKDRSDSDTSLEPWAAYEDYVFSQFIAEVNAIIPQPNLVDCIGIVRPDHVPAYFGDYGEP